MNSLLSSVEPGPILVERATSTSPFFFTCDHASERIPAVLGDLGVSDAERQRHIAWDIGALGVAQGLARHFGAPLIATNYSRLVIDCNRPVWREDSIPLISEYTEIPGNHALKEEAREARRRALYRPYHAQITALLDARAAAGLVTLYLSVHSFTPVYKEVSRPWQVALLSNRDRRVAEILLRELRKDPTLCVGDNIPYRLTDEGDYGVPVHGEQRGLPHALLEIRQDQIADEGGQAAWVKRLAPLLCLAAAALGITV